MTLETVSQLLLVNQNQFENISRKYIYQLLSCGINSSLIAPSYQFLFKTPQLGAISDEFMTEKIK